MIKLNPKAVWLFFVQNIILSSFSTIFLILILSPFLQVFLKFNASVFLKNWLGYLLIITFAIIIIALIKALLMYEFWKYQLSERALKVEKGIIFKKYISIPYDRIQNVDIYRSLLARILGLSDLQVQTAGYASSQGRRGRSEGRLPGLGIDVAEKLRETLVNKISKSRQGL